MVYSCKSMDWFLYDNGLRHERVKSNFRVLTVFLKKSVYDLKLLFNTLVGKISLIVVGFPSV